MGFADVTQQALQSSILGSIDPALARGLLERDLNRTQQSRGRRREDQQRQFEADVAQAEHERTSGQLGFGHLRPDARIPQYRPTGNPNQYLLDAILKDQALARYDREAPQRREDLARGSA